MLKVNPMAAFSDGARLTQPKPISHITNAHALTPAVRANANAERLRLSSAGSGMAAAAGLPTGPTATFGVRRYAEIASLPSHGPRINTKA